MKNNVKTFKPSQDGTQYPVMEYTVPTLDDILGWVKSKNTVALENVVALVEDQLVQHTFSTKHRTLVDAKKAPIVQSFDWSKPVSERAQSVSLVEKLRTTAIATLGEGATEEQVNAWVEAAAAKIREAQALQKLMKGK